MDSSRYLPGLVITCAGAAGIIYYLKSASHKKWKASLKNYCEIPVQNKLMISSESDWNQDCEDFLKKATKFGAVGLDCEWVTKAKVSHPPVSLLQIGTHDGDCLLVRLSKLNNIPESLGAFLMDPSVIKAGVAIDNDVYKLFYSCNISVTSWIDLRFLAIKTYDKFNQTPGNKLGLKSLSERHLNMHIKEFKYLRMGDWDADTLSEEQISYAASDANQGIRLLLNFVADLYDGSTSGSFQEVTKDAMVYVCEDFISRKYNGRHVGRSQEDAKRLRNGNHKTSTKRDKLARYSTRKRPLYHNSMLLAPDDEPLCTCDPDKAAWYVSKGLAEKVSDDPFIVRLNFEPSGRSMKEGDDGQFYLQERSNRCVVCGREESYIRKNVIPHDYRRYFPEILKSHQSHDIVLLCLKCHQLSNIRDKEIRYTLAKEFDAPIGVDKDVKTHVDPQKRRVRNLAGNLVDAKKNIPDHRLQEMRQVVMDYYGVEELTDELIQEAIQMDVQIVNDEYIPHGRKVYEAYCKIGLIRMEERFRQWFLDSMKPQFLPDCWSISHNHSKLKVKMEGLSPDDPLRRDYQMALYGVQ